MRTLSSLVIGVICLAPLGLSQAAEQNIQGAAPAAAQKKEPAPVPVPIKDGKIALTPKNTITQFIGRHIGERPDPRTGYFTKFAGELSVGESTKALHEARLDIDTGSLVTPIAKLTNHLHSPDFFSVKEYPNATFQSTKIQVTDAARGKYKISGDLTIRDIEKSIVFPATLRVSDDGVVLTSKFKIKRSDFGMTFGPDRVEDEVAMTVTVGKPTPKVTPQ